MRVISTLEYRRGLDSINALTDNEVLHISDTFDQEYIEFVLKKVFLTVWLAIIIVLPYSSAQYRIMGCHCMPKETQQK